jgi:hypothetical protein
MERIAVITHKATLAEMKGMSEMMIQTLFGADVQR